MSNRERFILVIILFLVIMIVALYGALEAGHDHPADPEAVEWLRESLERATTPTRLP